MPYFNLTETQEAEYTEKSIQEAREMFASTRAMHLPRAPLYVPGEQSSKGKPIPLGPIGKRMLELRKRFPQCSMFEAQRIELDNLLQAAWGL